MSALVMQSDTIVGIVDHSMVIVEPSVPKDQIEILDQIEDKATQSILVALDMDRYIHNP